MRDRERARGVRAAAGAVTLSLAVALAFGAARPVRAVRPVQLDGGGHPYIRPERMEEIYSLSCWGCHGTIAEEWAATAHGLAWLDERYQEAVADRRRPESCWGCHVPEPLHQAERLGGKPTPRTAETETLHFGVSCKSCHLGPEGQILGPWGEEQEAHRSERSPSFVGIGSNTLCIACHRTTIGPVVGIAKDFEQANLGGEGKSCVGCHMPAVERAMATDDADRPTRVREGRSHRLASPYDPEHMASGFDVSARIEAERAVVSIENLAGHRIPGLLGREIVFRATLLDPAGDEVGRAETRFDTGAYLRVAEVLELVVEGAGVRVRVEGEHVLPDGSGTEGFFVGEF